jgi:hypothetical protein
MRPVEARLRLCLDGFSADLIDRRDFLVMCLKGHRDGEDHPALGHPLVVSNPAAHQVGVREDELFAGEAPDARGLQPDAFHGSVQVVDVDEIAHLKGLIQDDGEGREEVAEDVLEGERNGHTPDSQSGYESGDVHAQIVKDQQHRKRSDDQLPP